MINNITRHFNRMFLDYLKTHGYPEIQEYFDTEVECSLYLLHWFETSRVDDKTWLDLRQIAYRIISTNVPQMILQQAFHRVFPRISWQDVKNTGAGVITGWSYITAWIHREHKDVYV